MNEEPEEPSRTFQITLPEKEAEVFERCLPSIMEHFQMNREESLAYAFAVGICAAQHGLIAAREREPQVKEAIRKLKLGEFVPTAELEALGLAAKSGHLDARIILSDIERFDRPIVRDIPPP